MPYAIKDDQHVSIATYIDAKTNVHDDWESEAIDLAYEEMKQDLTTELRYVWDMIKQEYLDNKDALPLDAVRGKTEIKMVRISRKENETGVPWGLPDNVKLSLRRKDALLKFGCNIMNGKFSHPVLAVYKGTMKDFSIMMRDAQNFFYCELEDPEMDDLPTKKSRTVLNFKDNGPARQSLSRRSPLPDRPDTP